MQTIYVSVKTLTEESIQHNNKNVINAAPLITVSGLYFRGFFSCSNIALPFTISFYVCMANR